MPEQESGLLGYLDGPRIVIAGCVLYAIFLSAFALYLWTDLREQVDRVDSLVAARLEEARAADRDSVNSCFRDALNAPPLRRALRALGTELESPEARAALLDFRRLSALNAPTVAECRLLAERLNVPVPKGIR